jgi:hypothetical protein
MSQPVKKVPDRLWRSPFSTMLVVAPSAVCPHKGTEVKRRSDAKPAVARRREEDFIKEEGFLL